MEVPSTDATSREAPQETRRASSARRSLTLFFLLAGLALALWLLSSVGWPAIGHALARVGWTRFLFLAAIYTLPQAAFAAGWWLLIDPRPPVSRLPRLFAIYLAGDALNYLAPGGVAGEPVKAHLLGQRSGRREALASLTLHKHADMVAQWIFVAAGVGFALGRFALPLPARAAAIAGVAVLGGALVLLTWGLQRGAYGPLLRLLARFETLARPLERLHDPAQAVDERVRTFPRDRPGRYWLSTGLCLLGWCGGVLETWLLLRFLVPSAGWGAAFAIETLALALNNMLLFIPGRVGGAEGVRAWIFILLGFSAANGVAYGLVRRGRELVWVLPGLLVLARERWLENRQERRASAGRADARERTGETGALAQESRP